MSVKEKSIPTTKSDTTKLYKLILHNDFNTFDWVINCLICVCKHSIYQATQCAYVTHFNGKCEVKIGEYEEIKNMKDELSRLNLTATISE